MEEAFEPVRANLTLIKHILAVSHVIDESEEADKDSVSLIGMRERVDSPKRPRTRNQNSPSSPEAGSPVPQTPTAANDVLQIEP